MSEPLLSSPTPFQQGALHRSDSRENLITLPTIPSMNFNLFSVPFEKWLRDAEASDWAGAFTLLDTLETFFDSRLDLLERRLKKQGEKLKERANEGLARIKTPTGEVKYARDIEQEVQKFKLKASKRMASLTVAWQSAKVVRTREKLAFFVGVMSVLYTALLFGMAPQWLHIVYTVQTLYFLPTRYFSYKKKAYHYFLFDLCYYVNALCLLYLWVFPGSESLWLACYLLVHGSLASAVITWRNSLVFHDIDKVTSLYIHIYPPLVFTVIRHFYPEAEKRFPAVATSQMQPVKALFMSALIYIVWQGLYWKFILVDQKKKIESGQRTTSFTYLLNDKRGAIGKVLQSVKEQNRIPGFMAGQLLYTIVTELPAVYLLYNSPTASAIFLLFIFAVSVWNGGGFYIEVFGRKFERELEALRKELADSRAPTPGSLGGEATPMSAPSIASSTPPSGRTTPEPSDDGHIHDDHDVISSTSNTSDELLTMGGPNILNLRMPPSHEESGIVIPPKTGMESGSDSPVIVGGPGKHLDMGDGFKLDLEEDRSATIRRRDPPRVLSTDD